MNEAVIGVKGDADRLLVAGLNELRPVFEHLGDNALVVGGLMARLWLFAEPIEIAPRATGDVDLGVDRKGLRIAGDRQVLAPLLEGAGFEPRAGEEQFRFVKEIDGGAFPVDLGVAPGSSRNEPPLLEKGIQTIAIPGLAYALERRTTMRAKFVADDSVEEFELPFPELDAAFVLKGALCEKGVRNRTDRRQRDTVDAVCLAAACVGNEPSLDSLAASRKRADVKAAIRWVRENFGAADSAAARRVRQHFEEESGSSGGGEWAVGVIERFSGLLEERGA